MSTLMRLLTSQPPRGTVYGTLLNFRDALDVLGDTVHQPRTRRRRRHRFSYIKPRNTVASNGDAVVVPHGVDALEIGASLGLVIGRTACRVNEVQALEFVLGYVIVNYVSVALRPVLPAVDALQVSRWVLPHRHASGT